MIVGIYGASGFGREVMPVIAAQLAGTAARIFFIDDGDGTEEIHGSPVLSWGQFAAQEGEKQVAIAIADSRVRSHLTDRCSAAGFAAFPIKAANVFIGNNVVLGHGSILQPFTCLTGDSSIGIGFHGNIYSYVAHDCLIGDFVTFAPGVKCNGNVQIGDHAYIGTGAILKQGTPDKPLRIGPGAVIGMGAVVTKDVAEGETVVGNPARPMQR